jgi:hypothetical protein
MLEEVVVSIRQRIIGILASSATPAALFLAAGAEWNP